MHARRGDMGRPRCPMAATAAQNAKFPPQYRRYTFDRPDGREAALSEKMQKKLHVTQECGINNELDVALAHRREYETCRSACFVADRAVLAVYSRPEILGEPMAREDWVHSSFTRRTLSIIILATAHLFCEGRR